MLLIWFSENIVNYVTFGTWLNYVNMDLCISPTGPLGDRSLVVVYHIISSSISSISIGSSISSISISISISMSISISISIW